MSLQGLLGPVPVQLPAGAQLKALIMGLFFAQFWPIRALLLRAPRRQSLSLQFHSQPAELSTDISLLFLFGLVFCCFFKHLIHISLLIFLLLFLLHSISTQGSTLLPARTHTRIQLRIINKETLVQDSKQSLERILFLAFQSWKDLLFLIFGDTN